MIQTAEKNEERTIARGIEHKINRLNCSIEPYSSLYSIGEGHIVYLRQGACALHVAGAALRQAGQATSPARWDLICVLKSVKTVPGALMF